MSPETEKEKADEATRRLLRAGITAVDRPIGINDSDIIHLADDIIRVSDDLDKDFAYLYGEVVR